MATTVGSHGVAAFVNPQNGQTGDASVVLANDNTLRAAYVNHDSDTGIHVQSSDTASRPSAGTAGRKWMTVDSGVIKLWYDDGSNWVEISYIQSTGTSTVDTLAVTNNTTLGSSDADTVTFNAQVASAVTPATDATHDLGTSSKKWRDGYFSRDLTVGDDITATGDVTAASFIGSGAGLTGITAASVAAGTFPGSSYTFTNALIAVGTATASSFLTTGGLRNSTAMVAPANGSVNIVVGAFLVREYELTGNTTFNLSNDATASFCLMIVRQDGSGSHTVAWTGATFPGAVVPTQTATAGRADVYLVVARSTADILVMRLAADFA